MSRRAILFDMDGVLIDACAIHRRTFREAYEAVIGPLWDDTWLEGRPTKVKLKMLGVPEKQWVDIQVAKQALTMDAARRYPRDDYRQRLLGNLVSEGFYVGCVTNSIRGTADQFLRSAGLRDYLDVLVTNEDVDEPKPSPAGYLKAMALLGADPAATLIVEDSEVGLQAAELSGANFMATYFDTLTYERIKSCFNS